MKRIKARFVKDDDQLLVAMDPAEITTLEHAGEILRDLIAQWVRERRTEEWSTMRPYLATKTELF